MIPTNTNSEVSSKPDSWLSDFRKYLIEDARIDPVVSLFSLTTDRIHHRYVVVHLQKTHRLIQGSAVSRRISRDLQGTEQRVPKH